jgi:hypothetical protein
MIEIRRTAESLRRRIGGQARPEQEESPVSGDAWGGWRRNVQKGTLSNRGDLFRREWDRSQSPRSSDEAANHRGAKGGRKVDA